MRQRFQNTGIERCMRDTIQEKSAHINVSLF